MTLLVVDCTVNKKKCSVSYTPTCKQIVKYSELMDVPKNYNSHSVSEVNASFTTKGSPDTAIFIMRQLFLKLYSTIKGTIILEIHNTQLITNFKVHSKF